MSDTTGRPTLTGVADELAHVRAQLEVNTAATLALKDTVEVSFGPRIDELDAKAEQIQTPEERAKERRAERWHFIKVGLVVLCILLVALSVVVYVLRRLDNGQVALKAEQRTQMAQTATIAAQTATIAQNQRIAALLFCNSVKTATDNIRDLLDSAVTAATDSNQRAQISPTATPQVKQLAAESLARTRAYVAEREKKLVSPDCSTLPKP